MIVVLSLRSQFRSMVFAYLPASFVGNFSLFRGFILVAVLLLGGFLFSCIFAGEQFLPVGGISGPEHTVFLRSDELVEVG